MYGAPGCKGSPLGPPQDVMPLGCAVSADPKGAPTFATCDAPPPQQQGQMRRPRQEERVRRVLAAAAGGALRARARCHGQQRPRTAHVCASVALRKSIQRATDTPAHTNTPKRTHTRALSLAGP